MVEKSFLTRPMTNYDLEFRAKIAKNPLDQVTRDVYSDYLEENGDQAEADRQRQWTVAYRGLEKWTYGRYEDDPTNNRREMYEWYTAVLKDEDICFSTTDYPIDDEELKQFYDQLEIVVGGRIPADIRKEADDHPFSCAC